MCAALGAIFEQVLTTETTFLLADTTGSDKYKVRSVVLLFLLWPEPPPSSRKVLIDHVHNLETICNPLGLCRERDPGPPIVFYHRTT